NKNDIIDAAAIAEAVTRPTMRFVELRSPEHIDLQALHRVRDRMMSQRTCLINQMRAFCLEYGIAIHQGAGKFKADLPRVLADQSNDLTSAMRRILASTFDELRQLELRIAEVNREIEAIASQSDTARRLMTIPGIGPLAATALLAAAGSARQFKKARDMAAWLGLVPREYSTGGKTKLLGISKRGNRYLRRMIIHGARSCVTHLDRSRYRLGAWLDGLQARMHTNKVTVALAAKIARIAWVVMTKPSASYERRDPAFS
ncbi:transposase, partial [Bradyrhizobium sp. GM2.2]|uniref:IS110 family transposase n=1 Tax=Bradyrhizobium sp. GM2.2 TaxID=3156358 RepID=UPI0033964D00